MKPEREPDSHKGAVEGDRPTDPQHGNPNAPGVDREGLPSDPVATAEDRIGATVENGEVAQASETGESSDALRDEERPLE